MRDFLITPSSSSSFAIFLLRWSPYQKQINQILFSLLTLPIILSPLRFAIHSWAMIADVKHMGPHDMINVYIGRMWHILVFVTRSVISDQWSMITDYWSLIIDHWSCNEDEYVSHQCNINRSTFHVEQSKRTAIK